MIRSRRILALSLTGVLVALCTSCVTRPAGDMVIGPAYQPTNIHGHEQPLPPNFRRVAVLPLSYSRTDLESVESIESALLDELGKAKRFEIVAISPEQLTRWAGARSLSSTALLPAKLRRALQEEADCDGILFAELTQFRAYPPLAVGWNLKLVNTRTGAVVWAADEVFDAGDGRVENGARLYQLHRSQVSNKLTDSRFILISPTAFCHYSAKTLFATLPPATATLKLSDTSPIEKDRHVAASK